MTKFFLFILLWRLLGNPFLALIVILAVFYFLERRYIGVLPSMTRPYRRNRMLSKLKQQLLLNPHDVSTKLEISRLLLEKKKYAEANRLLKEIVPLMENSAEVWNELGTTYLYMGDIEEGEKSILHALKINPRVKFGQPYLRLGVMYSNKDLDKSLYYLRQFHEVHSSSCEAYFLLGATYKQIGKLAEAKEAFNESLVIYKSLPKYMKRQERKWAMKSLFHKMMLGS